MVCVCLCVCVCNDQSLTNSDITCCPCEQLSEEGVALAEQKMQQFLPRDDASIIKQLFRGAAADRLFKDGGNGADRLGSDAVLWSSVNRGGGASAEPLSVKTGNKVVTPHMGAGGVA